MKPTRPHPNEIARTHGITLTARGGEWVALKGGIKQVGPTKRKALHALLTHLTTKLPA